MLKKRFRFCVVLFLIASKSFSQEWLGPIASYYFSGNANDTILGSKGISRGATLSQDRFGNENSAYSFDGKDDYINLGTNTIFKQITLSISLWVKINGYETNHLHYENQPFIVTKVRPTLEFNEAFFIGLYRKSNKFDAACTSNEKKQVASISLLPADLDRWHHIVYMFDTDSTYFYVDGKLNEKKYKGFFSNYLYTDSVILGREWNEGIDDNKLERTFAWLNGSLDDLKFFNRILSPEEIGSLYHESNPSQGVNTEVFKRKSNVLPILKTYWYIPIFVIVAILLVVIIVRIRIKRLKQRYKEKADLEKQLMQMEMQALRSQMNPHFIFNAINSIQHYVITNEKELASKYLIKFSKLMRNVLELSKQDQIKLGDELETVQLYIELESLRFEKDFNLQLNFSEEIDLNSVMLPPLLIQPFVENAIWHGLLLKEGDKQLQIHIFIQENNLIIEIEDNGIGRKAAGHFRKKEDKRKSLGMEITQSRLDVLEKVNGISIKIAFIDKVDGEDRPLGTKVIITLKLKN
jgi:hypothetical protein